MMGDWFKIINRHIGSFGDDPRCDLPLHAEGGRLSVGILPDGHWSQHWKKEPVTDGSDGWFKIINRSIGQVCDGPADCLPLHVARSGVSVSVSTDDSSVHHWKFVEPRMNASHCVIPAWIISLQTNPSFCIDVDDARVYSGARIQLYEYNGSSAQKFNFDKDSGYIHLAANPDFVLDATDKPQASRTAIRLHKRNGTCAQKWNFEDGLFKLADEPRLCLGVGGADPENGIEICLERVADSDAQQVQKWRNAEDLPDVLVVEWLKPGAARKAFIGTIAQAGRPSQQVVAKIGRRSGHNLQADVDDLRLAAELANIFSEQYGGSGIKALTYVDSYLARCKSENNIVQVEPKLFGKFEKFNEALGEAQRGHRTSWCEPDFFSHWSYERSEGKLLITDLQGVVSDDTGFICTDPYIHRPGQGMKAWLRAHKCNRLCRIHLPQK